LLTIRHFIHCRCLLFAAAYRTADYMTGKHTSDKGRPAVIVTSTSLTFESREAGCRKCEGSRYAYDDNEFFYF
jgi:hypothetical protein